MSGRFPRGNVISVGLHPGLVKTEGVLQFADYLDLHRAESPEGVGRVFAALAADGRKRHTLATGRAQRRNKEGKALRRVDRVAGLLTGPTVPARST